MPLVATTRASPGSTARPPSSGSPCRRADDAAGAIAASSVARTAGGSRWSTGKAASPRSHDPPQRVDERRAAGEVERDEASGHRPIVAVGPWLLQPRPASMMAHREPVDPRRPSAHAAGRGRARGRSAPVRPSARAAIVWWRVALALVVSLALQVGVNYANDYSDGIRGTDDVRVGPVRLVASGLGRPAGREAGRVRSRSASPRVAGLALARRRRRGGCSPSARRRSPAAWFYTGGPKPVRLRRARRGVRVRVLRARRHGRHDVRRRRADHRAGRRASGARPGSLACALLVVNNLRDIPSDTVAGKRTLAVRLGDRRTRRLYVALVVVAFVLRRRRRRRLAAGRCSSRSPPSVLAVAAGRAPCSAAPAARR